MVRQVWRPTGSSRAGALVVAGAVSWLLTLGYFVVQPVVAAAWDPPYSITANMISELGVTSCGVFDRPGETSTYVCSPRHAVMNVTFVVTGLLTTAGALLTRRHWPRRAFATMGLAFVALGGLGGVMVGLAPADVSLAPHIVGALLQVPGAAGPLLIGVTTVRQRPWEGAFSLLCGVVGTAGCLLFVAGLDLGLGPGGMEHVALDPLTVWTGLVGVGLLVRRRKTSVG